MYKNDLYSPKVISQNIQRNEIPDVKLALTVK